MISKGLMKVFFFFSNLDQALIQVCITGFPLKYTPTQYILGLQPTVIFIIKLSAD